MSDVHTALGLAIPVLLIAHIWWGRRGTDRKPG
jgi:hypothetical protein